MNKARRERSVGLSTPVCSAMLADNHLLKAMRLLVLLTAHKSYSSYLKDISSSRVYPAYTLYKNTPIFLSILLISLCFYVVQYLGLAINLSFK